MSYADSDYYTQVFQGTTIPDEKVENALKIASRHIDTLTYNRIVGKGMDALTPFQQEIIREVCCSMAEFEYENEDIIQSVLKSYSINGTSMEFGQSWNMLVISGIAIRRDIYEYLSQTGLCCSRLG